MASKTTSQTQHDVTESFQSLLFGFEKWRDLAEENLGRARAFSTEVAKLEKTSAEQLGRAIEDGARLMHESLAYGLELTETWRKTSVEMLERSIKMMDKH